MKLKDKINDYFDVQKYKQKINALQITIEIIFENNLKNEKKIEKNKKEIKELKKTIEKLRG